jgi:hypothetical protein
VTRKMLTGSPSLSSATCAVPRQSTPGRALATSRRADHPGLGDEGCLHAVMLLEMLQLGTRTMEVRCVVQARHHGPAMAVPVAGRMEAWGFPSPRVPSWDQVCFSPTPRATTKSSFGVLNPLFLYPPDSCHWPGVWSFLGIFYLLEWYMGR